MRAATVLTFCAVAGACGGSGTEPRPEVASLTLSPTSIATFNARGQTQLLTIVATDADGNVISNPRVTFETGSAAVATVSAAGLIASVDDGTTNITATAGAVSRSVQVTVRRKVTRITVTPNPTTVAPSATRALIMTAFDANNFQINGLTATWESDDPAAATVSGTGVVAGVAAGDATITATLVTIDGTFLGSSVVTVAVQTFPLAATVTLLGASFSPDQVNIAATGTVTFNNTSGVVHNVSFGGAATPIPDHASGSNQRTFNTPGTVPFSCSIHPGMAGTLTVH